jgi:hypothetical protein
MKDDHQLKTDVLAALAAAKAWAAPGTTSVSNDLSMG